MTWPTFALQAALVGVGGFAGAVVRQLANVAFKQTGWPAAGTTCVNVVGAYLIGFCLGYAGREGVLPQEWRPLVVTGVLGGLTTFSTLTYETIDAARTSLPLAMLILGGNIVLGLTATAAGIASIRH